MRNLWKRTRLFLLAALVVTASALHAWKLGREAGIRAQIGGPGKYKTALIEWRDMDQRKVIVYLNDGASGYAFWFRLDAGFKHYTHATKVFVCDNESPASIKEAMEVARSWCDNDQEGGDSRIVGGFLKDRADDEPVVGEVRGERTHEDNIRDAEREELLELRRTVNEYALRLGQ